MPCIFSSLSSISLTFSLVIGLPSSCSKSSSAKLKPASNTAPDAAIAPTIAPPAVVKTPNGPALNPVDPIAAPVPAPTPAAASVVGLTIALTDETKS